MTTRNFFYALSLAILSLPITSCEKAIISEPITEKVTPTLPDGNRIIIHFGTSTQRGCIYSFTNCIWIGWEKATDLHQSALTFQFDDGSEVEEQFGDFFPLTADCTVDGQNGSAPQVLKSGFYRFQLSPIGKKIIAFKDENLQPVAPLVNPNNPQDNLGQLHNLAMQAIFTTPTKDEIKSLDLKSARKLLTAKSAQFLETEAAVVLSETEQQQIEDASFVDNYDNHQAWLASSKLSANDRLILGNILDQVSEMPVNSPEQLNEFVKTMTEIENQLLSNSTLDDSKLVFSAVSVMKYSRYYWFWKSMASGQTPARPDWWKADVKGLIEGGIGQALVDSLVAALK